MKKMEYEKNVFVYAGEGTCFIKDVMGALRLLGIEFSKVYESGVCDSGLVGCDVLIIPGGWPQKYSANLGETGMENIRSFVKGGGRYVGICAGAYLAASTFRLDKGNVPGIGLADVSANMESEKFLPGFLREVEFTGVTDLSVGMPKKTMMWYENGPMLEAKGEETIARFSNGSAAIVGSAFGKGYAVLFSPHPEGCASCREDPTARGALRLLRNAIL